MEKMTFGEALQAIDEGKRVQRSGWNGKGMFLFLGHVKGFGVAGTNEEAVTATHAAVGDKLGVDDMLPCLFMKTADGKYLPGWLASQTDMLSDDWQVVT